MTRGSEIMVSVGKIAGATIAILTALWFFGEPFLEDYVHDRIEEYDDKAIEENSGKVGLRTLFSNEMNVNSDRVHIIQGEMYKQYLHMKSHVPRLDRYFSKNIPYLYLKDGKEVYVYNQIEYEVHRGESGYPVYFRDGKWRPIP